MEKKEKEKKLMKNIRQYLMRIGVPTHLKGYRYLAVAVYYCIENFDCYISMAYLYKKISEKYKVNSSKVERDIRYIIQNYKFNIYIPKTTVKYFITYISQNLVEQLELY